MKPLDDLAGVVAARLLLPLLLYWLPGVLFSALSGGVGRDLDGNCGWASGGRPHPSGPAIDPIQAPPNTPRGGKEEDPGEPAQEQGKEETRGNSAGEVLEGLRRKLEEERNQEERHTLKLRKTIRERERSFSEGIGGLDRPTYMELMVQHEGYHREREGRVLGLEVAIDIVEKAEEKQEQQTSIPLSATCNVQPWINLRSTFDQPSINL